MFKNYLYDESTYLISEFTIGFELEAWVASEDEDDFEDFKEFANNYFDYGKDITPLKKPWGSDPTINPDGNSECYDCDGQGYFTRDCCDCDGSGIITGDCPDCEDGTIDCPDCNGTGKNPTGQLSMFKKEDGKFEVEDCKRCKGTGKITCPTCDGYQETDITCPTCDGTGEDREECEYCYGTGEYSSDYYGDYKTFEWGSPIFKFIPKNLQSIINFLDTSISDYNINTNETCGFHIHIGFPKPSKKDLDMFWILCKLAIERDNKQFQEIKDFKGYSLSNKTYATFNIINDIRKVFINMESYNLESENKLQYLEKFYNDEKFRILRMHPQGTLEWRGARGFLDFGRREYIKQFLLTKLYPFIKWMGDVLDEDYIIFDKLKISRTEFDDHFSKLESPITKEPKRFSSEMDVNKISEVIRAFPFVGRMKFQNGDFDIVDGKLLIENIDMLRENTVDLENAIINNFYSDATNRNFKIKNCDIYGGNFHMLNLEFCNFKGNPETYMNNCIVSNSVGALSQNCNYNNFKGCKIDHNGSVSQSNYVNCIGYVNNIYQGEFKNSNIKFNDCKELTVFDSEITILNRGDITNIIGSKVTGNDKEETVIKFNNAEDCTIDNCKLAGKFIDCTIGRNTNIYNNSTFFGSIVMGDVHGSIKLDVNSKFRGSLIENGESSITFGNDIISTNEALKEFLTRNPKYV